MEPAYQNAERKEAFAKYNMESIELAIANLYRIFLTKIFAILFNANYIKSGILAKFISLNRFLFIKIEKVAFTRSLDI